MHCKKCGSELRPNAKFCSKCGSPVSPPSAAEEMRENKEPAPLLESPKVQGNNETAPRGKKIPVALIIVLLLIVCAVAGTVLYLNSNFNNDRKNIKTANELYVEEDYEEASEVYDAVPEIDKDSDEVAMEDMPEPSDIGVSDIMEEEETEEPEKEKPVLDIDVEDEVRQIREWYYGTQDSIDGYEKSTSDNVTFYLKNGIPVKIVVNKGTDGWDYAREYYYHDGEFYFAFIYAGSDEHRLYFKEDQMIRYIDRDKNTYDYGQTDQFPEWEIPAIQEAYRLLGTEDGKSEVGQGIKGSYIEAANNYVREGKYEQAITVLQQGYRETNDMRLESRRKYLLSHIVVTQCERYVVNTGELRGITTYNYDSSGKLTGETEQVPDEKGVPYRTVQISYRYDRSGNLTDVVRQSYHSDGNPGGRIEGHYSYNSSGEMAGYEDRYYDSEGKEGTTSSIVYSYDDSGNLIGEREQSVNQSGVKSDGIETVYEYDQSGKLAGKVLMRYYDGWSYPAGREETVYTYDRFGNLSEDTFKAFYDDGSWEEISTYNVLGYKTLTEYYDGDIEYIYTYNFIGDL